MKSFRLIHADGLAFFFREYADMRYIRLDNLHSLPLMSAGMAGVALVEGNTVSVADLALLLGRPPLKTRRNLHALVFGSHHTRLGLVWSGDQVHIEPEACREYELPVCLQNGVTEACVYHKKSLLPLINLKALQARVTKGEFEPQNPELIIPRLGEKPLAYTQIQVFECCAEKLALDASLVTEILEVPRRVLKLPCTPSYVRGVTLYKEKLIPLLDLSDYLKLPNAGKPGSVIIVQAQGTIIGLPAESLPVRHTTEPLQVYALPPLARAAYMRSIVGHRKELIPCIDIFELFKEKNSRTGTDSYTVSTEFSGLFLREDVEVVEFSLFGVKHAVPKTEVEDIIPYTPGRSLPLKLPILTGVIARNNLIVPVIDIARCFNIPSFTDKTWKLLSIKNGDFRAMVVTERVFGSKTLPVSIQRELPLSLPYPLVYGCYMSEDRVVLILNIWALAVNFRQQQAHDFYNALFKEFFQAYVHDGLRRPAEGPDAAFTGAAYEAATTIAEAAKPTIAVMSGEAEKPGATMAGAIEKPAVALAESAQGDQKPENLPVEPSVQSRNGTTVTAADNEDLTAPASAKREARAGTPPASESAAGETPYSGQAVAAEVTLAADRNVPPEVALPTGKTLPSMDRRQNRGYGPQKALPSGDPKPHSGCKQTAGTHSGSTGRKKSILMAAGIFGMLVLAGAVIFFVLKYKPFSIAEKSRPASAHTYEAPGRQEEIAANQTPEAPGRQEEIAANPAAEQDAYTPAAGQNAQTPTERQNVTPAVTENNTIGYEIQWGDTLAHIAQRFTGNPYDYKRIAKDNEIKDPDFILAGDELKIIIRK